MIRIEGVSYSYDGDARLQFADWSVVANSQTLLLGHSGCGKTTLLHLLGGLLKPDRGSVLIGDTDLTSLSGAALDHFRGRNIGFVFQKPHLIQALNVEDNLLLAQYLAGLGKDKDRVSEVLSALNIEEKRHSRVYELSEGQSQRVSIARAVLNHPGLILADEPTSSLDDDHCEKVISMLREQAEQNQATLMIATHDQRLKDIIPDHITLAAL